MIRLKIFKEKGNTTIPSSVFPKANSIVIKKKKKNF